MLNLLRSVNLHAVFFKNIDNCMQMSLLTATGFKTKEDNCRSVKRLCLIPALQNSNFEWLVM